AAERGVHPYAELLGATLATSSFHGTRLDVEHVSASVNNFVGQMENKWGLNRNNIAPHTFFMSHETYTPARGGSAQAEVKALRDTFGESTNSLVITNTKGFTGHPMGVGIEDAVLIYALATGRAPPIANHRNVDSELGDLNLSKGGDFSGMEFGLRFAAGFGSQMAVTMWKRCEIVGERIDGHRLMSWNRQLASRDDLELRILENKLVAYVGGEDNLHGGLKGEAYSVTKNLVKPEPTPEPVEPDVSAPEPALQTSTSTTAPVAPESAAIEQSPPVHSGDTSAIESLVVEVVVKHTGYPADFIELDQDLEGELGIDTVKQAEIMGDIRAMFTLPVDEEFILAEHPTLNHMIAYIVKMSVGTEPTSAPVSTAPTESIT
ncbi:MAG: phosphopantetheine-binding protein, partial [Candidatus Poseidoniales archaeon]|nr:phosphopantetheine-binding protein [Candidatus Poseidoniales archaeon]